MINSRRTLIGVLRTLLFQGGSQLAILVTAGLLAANLPPELYGQYAFGFQTATLMSTLLCFGASIVFANEWGKYDQTNECQSKVFHVLNGYVLFGMVISSISIPIFFLVSQNLNETLSYSFLYSLLLSQLLFHYYSACGRAPVGNLIQFSRSIFCLLAVYYLIEKYNYKEIMIFVTVLSLVLPLSIYVAGLIKRSSKIRSIEGSLKSNIALQNAVFVFMMSVDIIIVRILLGSNEVAIYSVALFLYNASSFGLYAINANIISKISVGLKKQSKKEFQKFLTYYARVAAILSTFLIIVLVIFADDIMNLIGAYYKFSYNIFLILIIGQLVNVYSGSVALILNLSGQEIFVSKAMAIVVVIRVLLCSILCDWYGLIGIAVGSAVTTISWNLLLLNRVLKVLKINPTPLKLGLKI